MTPEQDRYIADLTHKLQEAHSGHQPLTPSVLQHARAAVRLADAGRIALTEAEEERVDTLYGLLQWGQLAHPLQRIDLRLFAEQRRAQRAEGGKLQRPEWRD